MNAKLALLADRRARLVARAHDQRATLAHCVEPMRAPLEIVDRGIAVIGYIQRHPVVTFATVALTIALRPQRAGRWLRRGWVMWRLSRAVQSWAAGKPAAMRARAGS